MKIEIELEEVERLKDENSKLHSEVQELIIKLDQLDEKELIKKSIRLAKDIADKTLSKIFEKLGFENDSRFYDFSHYMDSKDVNGKYWWNSNYVEVTLGATVTNKMRSAFLKIGIVPKEQQTETDEIKLPD